MKKIICFAAALVILISSACLPAYAVAYNKLYEALKPYSEIVLLQSLENDTVLYEKNINVRTAPASLTKMITAIVTLENCKDVEEIITVPQSAIDMFIGTNSSNAGLKGGEQISLLNLLYCMLVPSANEAAAILADYIGGGSIAKFVDMMNDFVAKIGCTGTHFVNPHGLDEDGQYTTAADMARIAKYALTFSHSDLFEKITSTKKYTLPKSNMNEEKTIATTNFLMNSGYAEYYCKYVTGLKTGSTTSAGKCVMAKASSNGYSYLAVIMRGTFDDIDKDGYRENGAFMDAKKIFEWTFKNIKYETVLGATQVVSEIKVNLSTSADHVALIPSAELSAFVPSGVGENSVLVEVDKSTLPESIDSPVKKGQKVCRAIVYYAGEEIARTDLVAADDVSRNVFLYIVSVVKKLASTLVFRIIFALIILIVGGYIAVNILYFKKVKRRKNSLHVVSYRDMQKK